MSQSVKRCCFRFSRSYIKRLIAKPTRSRDFDAVSPRMSRQNTNIILAYLNLFFHYTNNCEGTACVLRAHDLRRKPGAANLRCTRPLFYRPATER